MQETEMVRIKAPRDCKQCGDRHSVAVPASQAAEFQQRQLTGRGAHVQDIFPSLDADDRETLINGLGRACWYQYVGEPIPEGVSND